ncbi:MAG: hypothetical protein HKN47_05205 [Pirellulaceae bacterium]|nr:hypothetical protein [Pirellulaceae bacterium]
MGRKSAGGIAVVVLVAIYSFAQPQLNDRFGWNLPGLRQDGRGQIVLDDDKQKTATSASSTRRDRVDVSKPNDSNTATVGNSPKPTGPLAGRMNSTATSNKTQSGSTTSRGSPGESKPSEVSSRDGDLLYGLLRETSPKRYLSPAGLMYTPGSAEGHRLEHLRRHTKDDPNRPGSHGVFDGGMEGTLKTIDLAYERAKKNQKTTKRVDDDRTIYTVDMGGRVGYVGGRTGQQRRNPMARRVQLVLEGTRVITAYPK